MLIDNFDANSVVIPFVGTLNDDCDAVPVIYVDKEHKIKAKMAQTPAIQKKKEQTKHYLRYLKVWFLKKEKLILDVFFITRTNRNIDATNVLDLIQNSGNKIIWNDDSQIYDVRSQRYVDKSIFKEMERMIVYAVPLWFFCEDQIKYRNDLYTKIAEDYKNRYDEVKFLNQYFKPVEISRFCEEGFWQDARFLRISALEFNYQQWHIKNFGGNPSTE
jgi:hypothetical protein